MKWTAENKVKAGTAGGIDAVVKAINIHISNAGVCENGCCALRSMTYNNGKNTWLNTNKSNEMNSWE